MNQAPVKNSLFKLSMASFIFSVVVLITIILPAEYNIDPTGIGEKLGLTKLAPENLASLPATKSAKVEASEDSVTVIVPANRGVEYKFFMQQHAKMTYKWHSDSGAIYHDLHGEPKGDTTGYFESYTIATVDKVEGSFTAPFAGSHGWYWKNTTDQAITITLTTSGEYQVEGLK